MKKIFLSYTVCKNIYKTTIFAISEVNKYIHCIVQLNEYLLQINDVLGLI